MLLNQLAKSLGELSLKSGSSVLCSHSRSLSGLTCASKTLNIVGHTNFAAITNIKQTSLLAPSTLSIINKRTWFSPMDEHGRGETAKNGYGVTLYDEKDGKRKSLKAVELRFKRLDWGMWIRPRSARDKKHWKKSRRMLIGLETHVFTVPYHQRRFDRAVLSDLKEIRHIPNDPYKVYNDMSWQNYHSLKRKNSERIKKYGNKIYEFNYWRAHYKKNVIRSDWEQRFWYEPPKYSKELADGDGVYTPDPSTPYDTPMPHYQLEERSTSTLLRRREKRYWRMIRKGEEYYGHITQSHPLKLPVYGSQIG